MMSAAADAKGGDGEDWFYDPASVLNATTETLTLTGGLPTGGGVNVVEEGLDPSVESHPIDVELVPMMSGYEDVTHDSALLAVHVTIGCCGVVGNLAVLLVISMSRGMRAKTANVFVANQSALDCVCGLLLIAGSLVTSTSRLEGMWGEVLCRLWLTKAPLWGLFISSTYNLVAFSLERYLQIVWPIVHRLALTSRRLAVVIVVVWLIGPSFVLAVQVPTSGLRDGRCKPLSFWANEGARAAHGIITIIIIYLIPVGTFVFCYTKIFLELRRSPTGISNGLIPASSSSKNGIVISHKKRSSSKSHNGSVGLPKIASAVSMDAATSDVDGEANNIFGDSAGGRREAGERRVSRDRFWRARRNTLKTLVTVCVVYVLCWCLNNALYVGFAFGRRLDFSSHLYHISVIFVFVNCCVNPVIYVVDNRNFRVALIDLVCCFCCCSSSSLQTSSSCANLRRCQQRRRRRRDVTTERSVTRHDIDKRAMSLVVTSDVHDKLFNAPYEHSVVI